MNIKEAKSKLWEELKVSDFVVGISCDETKIVVHLLNGKSKKLIPKDYEEHKVTTKVTGRITLQ